MTGCNHMRTVLLLIYVVLTFNTSIGQTSKVIDLESTLDIKQQKCQFITFFQDLLCSYYSKTNHYPKSNTALIDYLDYYIQYNNEYDDYSLILRNNIEHISFVHNIDSNIFIVLSDNEEIIKMNASIHEDKVINSNYCDENIAIIKNDNHLVFNKNDVEDVSRVLNALYLLKGININEERILIKNGFDPTCAKGSIEINANGCFEVLYTDDKNSIEICREAAKEIAEKLSGLMKEKSYQSIYLSLLYRKNDISKNDILNDFLCLDEKTNGLLSYCISQKEIKDAYGQFITNKHIFLNDTKRRFFTTNNRTDTLARCLTQDIINSLIFNVHDNNTLSVSIGGYSLNNSKGIDRILYFYPEEISAKIHLMDKSGIEISTFDRDSSFVNMLLSSGWNEDGNPCVLARYERNGQIVVICDNKPIKIANENYFKGVFDDLLVKHDASYLTIPISVFSILKDEK